jgi:hypothetical protein
MQAIELDAEVTSDHEIHLKLPNSIHSQTVKVIVLYEHEKEALTTAGKRTFGQFRDEIVIADDFDALLPDNLWTGDEP